MVCRTRVVPLPFTLCGACSVRDDPKELKVVVQMLHESVEAQVRVKVKA